MQEIAAYMEPFGHKLVHGERTKLDTPVTKAYEPTTERLGRLSLG
jgi:hypothetical protein